jgi:YVTN family beta-propeller protein
MRLVSVWVLILASALTLAAQTPSPALLVLSKADTTLAIVDPATLKVLARMPSGPDPHEVVVSSDGRFAYISNYGGGAYNTITPVDLVNQKTLPAIDLGALRGPHGLMFAGGKLWFTAEAAKVIGSFDPVSKSIDFILGTGQNRTHMILVSADLRRILTTNVSSATVSILEKSATPGRSPQGEWDQTLLPIGRGGEGFDLSPDGRELWVANAQDGTITILDVSGKKVLATLSDANVGGANRLKFTPSGKLVFVSSLRGSDVAVFDPVTRHEVKRIPTGGRGAAGIEMQPDGARVFVACTPDNYVAVIDLKSLEVISRLDAGPQPDGMAWAVRP